MESDDVKATRRSAGEVLEWLLRRVREMLSDDAGPFGSPEQLAELEFWQIGIDSLQSESLIAELEAWLERSIDSSVLLSATNLKEAAALICGATSDSDLTDPSLDDFTRYLNPSLGKRLARLRLNKTFVRGEGSWLWDTQGARYLDFVSGYGSVPFGHNPPEIIEALLSVFQSKEPNFVQPSALGAAGELARRLIEIAPRPLEFVTFANSGAEAIEASLKMCRAATGRVGVLATTRGFHGKTAGALAVTGTAAFREGFLAPSSDVEFIPYGDLGALRRALLRRSGYFAAFVVEPVQGEGGVVVPPAGYLASAAELCRGNGTLLVADEVQTGLGRTGALFASATEGVIPDVLVLAKALGGGVVPIGACLASRAAYTEHFALLQSSTFAGGSIACRVGLASLDLLLRDGRALLGRVLELGAYLRSGLDQLARRFPAVIAEVRGRGLMLGVEFAADLGSSTGLMALAMNQEALPALVASYMLNVEGVRVLPTLGGGRVLRIQPPLTVTRDECELFLRAFERALALVAQGASGRMLRAIAVGVDAAFDASGMSIADAPTASPRPPIRFGFLAHPLEPSDFVQFDPSLDSLDVAQLQTCEEILAAEFEPFVAATVTLVSRAGRSIDGDFIVIPRTARNLMSLSEARATAEVERGVELARGRGARIVGLGGYTSIVTRGGSLIQGRGVPITTGNAYTVAAGYEALLREVEGRAPGDKMGCAAIIGATGSIGRAMAVLCAGRFSKIVLVGNPSRDRSHLSRRLMEVALGTCRAFVTLSHEYKYPGSVAEFVTNLAEYPADGAPAEAHSSVLQILLETGRMRFGGKNLADVTLDCGAVVAATSTHEPILYPRHLQHGAVVCDLSRPRNVHPSVLETRPDVTVLEGGLIRSQASIDLRRLGLPADHVYACMAETMLLALEGREEVPAAMGEIQVQDVILLRELAAKHGFEPARRRRQSSEG